MSTLWTIIGCIAIIGFLLFIFGICRAAGQADHMANYDEEYANDFFDEDEEDMY